MASEYDNLNYKAACVICGFVFNLAFDPSCPRCSYDNGEAFTEGEKLDLAELDKLYALEDRRQ